MRHAGRNVGMVIAILGLIGILTVCSTLRRPTAPVAAHFSILTYNLNVGSSSSKSVQAILDADADVVCLQEITPQWEAILRRDLGQRYSHMFFDTNVGVSGAATLSKFPLVTTSKHGPAGGGWFPAGLATVKTPLGPVQILNLHLRPRISDKGGAIVGHFTIETIHRAEVEAYWALLDAAAPVVVVGDMNETEEGKAMMWLKGKGLVNTLPLFDRRTATWHGKIAGIWLSYRGDHILHGPGLHAYSAKVVEAGESDHLPVYAELGTPTGK